MTSKEFIKEVRDHLRNRKGAWYNHLRLVDGHEVGLKFYGRSIQILRIDGLDHGGLWDIPTQKAFVAYIEGAMIASGIMV